MRRIILGLGVSLDGYIARLDDSIDFFFRPRDYPMGPFFKTVDTAIMGRKSYEAGLRLGGGSLPNAAWDIYVFSRSLPPSEHNGATIVGGSPTTFVASLRKQTGKHM
jgi:dihydrofolate reductase